MIQLNIDASAAVAFTNQLEKLHRSALPVAVRGTLNKAAFDVKMNSMPRSAERAFIKRRPNFFKANSAVEMATGFDLKTMRATVGFVSSGLHNQSTNYSVRELEQQEYGGSIEKRTFIPLDSARVGGAHDRLVKPMNRLEEIDDIVNSNTLSGNSPKAKFIKAAIKAGVGGHVIGNLGKKKLYQVVSINKGAKMEVRTKALYSFQLGRSVRVGSTGFMRTASDETAARMYLYYQQEAQRQIQRLKAAGVGSGFGNKRGARGSLGRISRSFFR